MGTVKTPYVTDALLAQIRACKRAGMKDPAIVDKLEARHDRISVEHALTFTEFKAKAEEKTDEAKESAAVEDVLPPPTFKKR